MTVSANRKQIILLGLTNTGKSSLFNALLNQNKAIVSSQPGTTTDPVEKAMELLPYGPVTLIDTAGLADTTMLGKVREVATRRLLTSADLVLYLFDGNDVPDEFAGIKKMLEENEVPYILVQSKSDLATRKERTDCVRVSVRQPRTIEKLRDTMVEILRENKAPRPLFDGIFAEESADSSQADARNLLLLVIPLDSAAPVGRLILPQVQVIRESLDYNLLCMAANENTLPQALEYAATCAQVLVVTDSQVFGRVEKLLPDGYPLTSFSMLMARQKGDFDALAKAAEIVDLMRDGSKILIAENCTHNITHEDIGRVKIPKALEKLSGSKLEFEFTAGKDFPDDLSPYAMVVHCGGCMITPRTFEARQKACAAQNVPMTNYGMVLAAEAGILERSIAVFR